MGVDSYRLGHCCIADGDLLGCKLAMALRIFDSGRTPVNIDGQVAFSNLHLCLLVSTTDSYVNLLCITILYPQIKP